MIKSFTLTVITATLMLTGCAKITAATSAATSKVDAALTPAKPNIADFSSGPTVVTITHLPAQADDGEPIYVTVDGTDAGILAINQTVELHVNAGKHKIGGYARSLVGRVTIPAVEVTTEPLSEQHVNYSITGTTPKFVVGPSTKAIFSAPTAAKTAPTAPVGTTTAPAATTSAPAATTTAPNAANTAPASTTTTQAATTATPDATTTTPPASTTTTPASTTTTPASTTTTPASTTTTPAATSTTPASSTTE